MKSVEKTCGRALMKLDLCGARRSVIPQGLIRCRVLACATWSASHDHTPRLVNYAALTPSLDLKTRQTSFVEFGVPKFLDL